MMASFWPSSLLTTWWQRSTSGALCHHVVNSDDDQKEAIINVEALTAEERLTNAERDAQAGRSRVRAVSSRW